MASQRLFQAPLDYENNCIQNAGTPELYGIQGTNLLVKGMLDNDQTSRRHLAYLETLVKEERDALKQARLRCNQLTQTMEDLRWAKNRLESALHHANSDNGSLQHELNMQKSRSHDLESQVATLFSLSDSLLRILGDAQYQPSQKTSADTVELIRELQKQQEQVIGLQDANRDHAESIRALQATVNSALVTNPCLSSCGGSDGTTLIGTSFSTEEECPLTISAGDNMNAAHVAPNDLVKEGTWYEE